MEPPPWTKHAYVLCHWAIALSIRSNSLISDFTITLYVILLFSSSKTKAFKMCFLLLKIQMHSDFGLR
jgi:hypothetical protein